MAKDKMTNIEYLMQHHVIFGNLKIEKDPDHPWINISMGPHRIGIIYASNEEELPLNIFLNWLDKPYEKINLLDDVERRYLNNVLRPFNKANVKTIMKMAKGNNDYQIFIRFKDNSYITFPVFAKETNMYMWLEVGKGYTIDELGLGDED